MRKLFLENIDSKPADDEASGLCSQPVFDRDDHPLHLHVKTLVANAKFEWENALAPRLAFVWEGSVSVGGVRLSAHSVFVVEQGSRGAAVATEEGARLLWFGGGSDMPDDGHAGGKVHMLPAHDAHSTSNLDSKGDVGATLWVDADCPGCTLWLHGNSFRPGYKVNPHHHDEPEIIVVLSGAILMGSKSYGRGSALQVSKYTEYTFRSGDDGLSYIVFHPRAPKLISVRYPTIDEQPYYQKACGKPQPIHVN